MLPKNANLYKDNINKIQFYTLYTHNISKYTKFRKKKIALIFHMLNLQSV